MVRHNQDIKNVAMENGFYDLDLLDMLNRIDAEKSEPTRRDIMSYMGTNCWDDVVSLLGDKRFVEKEHFANLEGVYSKLLKVIIQKSYNGYGRGDGSNPCIQISNEQRKRIAERSICCRCKSRLY